MRPEQSAMPCCLRQVITRQPCGLQISLASSSILSIFSIFISLALFDIGLNYYCEWPMYYSYCMDYNSLNKIRNRIVRIIDSTISGFEENVLYGLDEAKLEDLQEFIKDLIVPHVTISKATKISPKSLLSLPEISLPKPVQPRKTAKLVKIQNDEFHTYRMDERNHGVVESQKLGFEKGKLRKYCSVVQVSENEFLLSGGLNSRNPRHKSDQILLLNTTRGELTVEGRLMFPLSSHTSVFIAPCVYLIGGKKEEGIITKECSAFNVETLETVSISSLNYGAASACSVSWQGRYIYKIGGLGQCFGEWSISPYIERYSLLEDMWEVMNPKISVNSEHFLKEFQLYAYSLAYVSQSEEQLIILGGFGDDKKGSDRACVIQIGEEHEIVGFGTIAKDSGGYWCQQYLVDDSEHHMYCIQTVTTPKLSHKLCKMPLK